MSRDEFTRRRKVFGLTQNEVARRIRLDQGAFSRVVSGRHPAPRTWIKVRQLFARLQKASVA